MDYTPKTPGALGVFAPPGGVWHIHERESVLGSLVTSKTYYHEERFD